MPRLYQTIYLTILASLVVVVVTAGVFWRIGSQNSPATAAFEMAGELAAAALPPPDAPASAQRNTIARFAQLLDADLALFDRHGGPIAAVGRPLPSPHPRGDRWAYGAAGPVWSFQLPDERWLAVRPRVPRHHPAFGMILFLGVIAIGVGLSAYPVARGLTRRLERLQVGVETLGAGHLSARVKVEGRDEIARLAESFNRSAERIEALVNAHRMLLANASHELRTPLSRIRLGIELFQTRGDPKFKAGVERDLAELDLLIDEILLTSRLEALQSLQVSEEIDLLALAAEECAHYDGIAPDGEPVTVEGDARLLRRLIRNLLDNAVRHGRPPVGVTVTQSGGQALLEVTDGGAGVAEAERERVFEPFHQSGSRGGGTGLGLSLVRQIARLHGGDAVVASAPQPRSCFRVTLPRKGARPLPDAKRPAP